MPPGSCTRTRSTLTTTRPGHIATFWKPSLRLTSSSCGTLCARCGPEEGSAFGRSQPQLCVLPCHGRGTHFALDIRLLLDHSSAVVDRCTLAGNTPQTDKSVDWTQTICGAPPLRLVPRPHGLPTSAYMAQWNRLFNGSCSPFAARPNAVSVPVPSTGAHVRSCLQFRVHLTAR